MKIEFDLPEFEKELNINIIIRKDGEVVCSASSPTDNMNERIIETTTIVDDSKNSIISEKETQNDIPQSSPTLPKRSSGNMMDIEF